MVESTANQAPSQSDRIDALAEQIRRLTDGMQAFVGAAISTLSGVPQSTPIVSNRRRGRPPGSKNKTTLAAAQAVETPAEKPWHPIALRAVSLLDAQGRMTQTELAKALKIERSHLAHHMQRAIKEGKAIKRITYPNNVETCVFYSPKWAHFKGE